MIPNLVRSILSSCVVVATVSCAVGPDQIAVRVETPDVWAGNEVRLHAENMAAQINFVTLGIDTVAAVITPPSTITIRAPAGANGLYDVHVYSTGGARIHAGSARVYGYRDTYAGPGLTGYVLPNPDSPQVPVFLANGESSLVRVDLRTLQVQAYPGAMHRPWCTRGPGPTPDPDVVLLAALIGIRCHGQLWRLRPTLQLVEDSVPLSDRITAQLSADVFIFGQHHLICFIRRTGPVYDCRRHEEINGIRYSPRRDRAIVYHAYGDNMPVYSPLAGDTAFALRDGKAGMGGGFSQDGDTLFMGAYDNTSRLLIANANTGELLGLIPLDGVTVEDAAVDPSRGIVYVLGWTVNSGSPDTYVPQVFVIDRGARAVIARITGTASSTTMCYSCDNRLFIDPGARVLYVLGIRARQRNTAAPGPASVVSRFDLMP